MRSQEEKIMISERRRAHLHCDRRGVRPQCSTMRLLIIMSRRGISQAKAPHRDDLKPDDGNDLDDVPRTVLRKQHENGCES